MHSAPSAAAPRALPRRNVLAGAAGLIGLALVTGTASSCSSEPAPPPVDPLLAQADQADADSAMASAAATVAAPTVAPALTQIASERAQHSRALRTEIARAAGHSATETSTTAGSSTTTTSAAPTPPPTVPQVVAALKQSASGAATLAAALTGYRAGLLGSIAASCTTSYTVGLPS